MRSELCLKQMIQSLPFDAWQVSANKIFETSGIDTFSTRLGQSAEPQPLELTLTWQSRLIECPPPAEMLFFFTIVSQRSAEPTGQETHRNNLPRARNSAPTPHNRTGAYTRSPIVIAQKVLEARSPPSSIHCKHSRQIIYSF